MRIDKDEVFTDGVLIHSETVQRLPELVFRQEVYDLFTPEQISRIKTYGSIFFDRLLLSPIDPIPREVIEDGLRQMNMSGLLTDFELEKLLLFGDL